VNCDECSADFGGLNCEKPRFTMLSGGVYGMCGVKSDQTIACWGPPAGNFSLGMGLLEPPAEEFDFVSVGYQHACGVKEDKTLECWGEAGMVFNGMVQPGGFGKLVSPPAGTFNAVSVNADYACGLRTDNTIVCWGTENGPEPPAPPTGEFIAISRGCGIRVDNTIACWEAGIPTPPQGEFAAIDITSENGCGVKIDGSVECWYGGAAGIFQDVFAGANYVSISLGQYSSDQACGVTDGNIVVCSDEIVSPSFPVSSVEFGEGKVCGLRLDNSVVCWYSITNSYLENPNYQIACPNMNDGIPSWCPNSYTCVDEICTGSLLGSVTNPAESCFELWQQESNLSNGYYWIEQNSMGGSKEVYCDMTTAGGGWTLAILENDFTVESAGDFVTRCFNAGFSDAGRGMEVPEAWLVTKNYLHISNHELKELGWPNEGAKLAMPMWKYSGVLATINFEKAVILPENKTGDYCDSGQSEPLCGYWFSEGWSDPSESQYPDPEDWPWAVAPLYLNCSFR
jgi:hypothetical protein